MKKKLNVKAYSLKTSLHIEFFWFTCFTSVAFFCFPFEYRKWLQVFVLNRNTKNYRTICLSSDFFNAVEYVLETLK